MHKLNRTLAALPQCLVRFRHGRDRWENLGAAERQEVRNSLAQLQGQRCAYCEGDLETLGDHIEHFRCRHRFPHLTFNWTNLFRSCAQKDSCGHFKDSGAGPYDPDDLLDPCCDDPDDFFVFRADGTINVRQDLSSTDAHRARETLRVFSLDPEWGRLRAMRKAAVEGYVSAADEAHSAGWSLADISAYFNDELEWTRELPFCTAIRHVLTER